ncbi:MAG: class I SAM-dependent methyltransferase [Sedimentisphaerales bacterium]|nr:class I SAM-dependent methyltransferase [Sedimentisphaerales bacterium]
MSVLLTKTRAAVKSEKTPSRTAMQDFYNSDKYINHVGETAHHLKESRTAMIRQWVRLEELSTVVELGCSVGAIQDIHPDYIGMDISRKALARLKGKRICCDIENMPLKNHSASLIVSFTTLEHVARPERVLEECSRILEKGGTIILADAWNIRPWVTTGITALPWKKASLKQKLLKVFYTLAGSVCVRACYFVPRRLFWEVQTALRRNTPAPLYYKTLTPNYDDFLVSDSDAVSSIESHSVLMWFKSRGFHLLNAQHLLKRLFFRGVIVVRK